MMTCSKQLLAKVNNLIHLYNERLLKHCLKNNCMIDDHKLYVGHDVQHTHTVCVCSVSTTRPSNARGWVEEKTVFAKNQAKMLRTKNVDYNN